jgi:hypothetical protein
VPETHKQSTAGRFVCFATRRHCFRVSVTRSSDRRRYFKTDKQRSMNLIYAILLMLSLTFVALTAASAAGNRVYYNFESEPLAYITLGEDDPCVHHP